MSEQPAPATQLSSGDPEPVADSTKVTWPGYDRFGTVQDILDQNKILITEINANHEAQTSEGLARNVILIRELNNNIRKVVEHYKELSASFQELGSDEDMLLLEQE
ncbi:hypothetical protein WJX84_006111 [Apatococcus fuscideae]|uniref:Protein EARLY FLOWERING 4 domain-containing protein n=1 Tax=Apatococcus fuscideae TaxID=2026836 RepID=A0AAW1TGV2_9CHLO